MGRNEKGDMRGGGRGERVEFKMQKSYYISGLIILFKATTTNKHRAGFFFFFWLNGGAEEAEVAEMKENPEMKMAEEDTEAHCSTG